jgi:twitching motility protein PilJ
MSLSQWFYNRRINDKQLIALIVSQLVPILGIGIGGTLIIAQGLRSQLLEQAKSEVAVTDINYNIKINQMAFGFRGQSDNPAIIKVASLNNAGQSVTPAMKAEVKQILQNEIKARKIEYATLVGRDLRIIVNANNDRSGEVFDPGNLVSEVIRNSKQIKASKIASWSELQKERPALPPGFTNQDALIRYTFTPVKDSTGVVIGVLISGDVVNGKTTIVKETLNATGGGYSAIYFRKPNGQLILATSLLQSESQNLNQLSLNQAEANVWLSSEDNSFLEEAISKFPQGQTVTSRKKVGDQTYTIAARAIPSKLVEEVNSSQPDKSEQPVAILVRGTPENALNSLLSQSLQQQAFVVLVALILIGLWILILRRGIIRPIEQLEQATQKFATGDRTSRAPVFASDEVGQLAVAFNTMADSINKQTQRQEQEAKLALQLNEINARMRETLNSEKILKASVANTYQALSVDRLLFYRLDENWQGKVTTESVGYQWTGALGDTIHNPYLVADDWEEYEIGSLTVVDNIFNSAQSKNYIKQLEPLAVKAFLLAPVFVNKKLYGLLAAHQCSEFRKWQDIETNLFKQVATQIGYALEQAELLQVIQQGRQTAEFISGQERQQKEALQIQILALLDDIEGAANGDLTVRANVNENEIGTVADFFNSIVESLRLIVTKVKTSAMEVSQAIGSNEGAIHQLADEAEIQAGQINRSLNSVNQMTLAMQTVASKAELAAKVAQNASMTANRSGEAMNMTVQNIMHLRETVGDTAKKVKRLGESTQEITRVASLINQISMQTNLLAINVGIEAARAGEQGQGFAAVAEEVAELAARSSASTKEIEHIIENIQRETTELAEAMEVGTAQVVEGTRVVEDAKYSLSQILEVSRQIDSLVQSISTTTTSGVETSQTLSQLMKEIATSSERTTESSRSVSASLKKTVEISQELEETVGTFKVG